MIFLSTSKSKYGEYGVCEWDNYDYTLPNLSHEELLKLKQESKKRIIKSINDNRKENNESPLSDDEINMIMSW